MQRIAQTPRVGWQQRLEDIGFHFHSIDPEGVDRKGQTDKFMYWREDVAYRFTSEQVDLLDDVSKELHDMCIAVADDLVARGELERLRITPAAQALAERSWRNRDPHLYGRFDLSWSGSGQPKLLEYNADTPTSIIESAVAQWDWKVAVHPRSDQFNSLHEKLVERLRRIAADRQITRLHMACLYESQEDVGNLEYLMDVALQAGLEAVMLDMGQIALLPDGHYAGEHDEPMQACFKLYPWEWLTSGEELASELGAALPRSRTQWIEPAWKMLLSNKALLPLLWERFPGHPNLLPAYFEPSKLGSAPHVRKPLLSREGCNISCHVAGEQTLATGGDYGEEGFVYQALAPVASFSAPEATSYHGPRESMHAVIGSWIVGDEPAGICVREDISPITSNTAYFVPHYFD